MSSTQSVLEPERDQSSTVQSSRTIRVLLCEDERADYVLVHRYLQRITGTSYALDWARSVEEAYIELMARAHDVALVDYLLHDGSGLDILREAIAMDWPGPVIMLSGIGDRSVDVAAMKLGAADFLRKDELRPSTLERSIRYNMEKKRLEATAIQTNREMLQYIAKLRDAKIEIESQNRRIVSLAHHLAVAGHGDSTAENISVSAAATSVDGDGIGTWHLTAEGRTLAANEAVLALFETGDVEALSKRSLDVLLSNDSRQRLQAALEDLQPTGAVTIEVELIGQATGRHSWAVLSLLPGAGIDDTPVYLATVVDITGRRNVERANRYLAQHDSLTGLANRAAFDERLAHAASIAERNGSLVGLICIDLDGFKQVNDTYGHLTGDKLLREVGTRLTEAARESDTVARLGGDEFGIIATNLARREDAASVARKVAVAFDRPFSVRGHDIRCGGSIGVAVFPVDGDDLESLFDRADNELYRDKRARG